MLFNSIKSIVFDIDGCLLNTRYQYTIPFETLCGIIQRGKSEGMTFNINSNRSLSSMLKIYNELDFNGFLIGEGGAYLYDPNTDQTDSFTENEVDRSALIDILNELTPNVAIVDTDEVIKRPQEYAEDYTAGEVVIFLEQSRKFTMTAYPRIVQKGTLVFDQGLLESIAIEMVPEFTEYFLAANLRYGNILLSPKNLEKGSMFSRLPKPIASFGDTNQDISMFENSDFCGAPSNATENVKRRVFELKGFVSNKDYTAGAYEFINKALSWRSR